jgi:hypothetical protein
MANTTPAISDFTTGEISKRLYGRVNLKTYLNACAKLENMFVYPYGGATRRTGTQFAYEVKDSTKFTRVIPFVFSTVQAYILEFGEGYIRFYRDYGILVDCSAPYEIVSPYAEDDLQTLEFTQSADVLTIVHPFYAPRELVRTADTSWSLNVITFTAKPAEWASDNYPVAVTYFQQRLVFGGTPLQPNKFWMSKASDFNNMTTGSEDDDAMALTLDSDTVNAIVWMKTGRNLMIGTNDSEWVLGGSSTNKTVTPNNYSLERQTTYGSESGVGAWLVGNAALYTQYYGRKVREMAYRYELDQYPSPDMSLLSEHMGRESYFVASAYAAHPDSVLWVVRNDGVLLSLTYQRDQEVTAWARHTTDGFFESVACIPGDTQTDVWFVVRRTIDGVTKRYVEYLNVPFSGTSTNDPTCRYLDSALTYAGSPQAVISGYDHLAGETVSILADGAAHPDVVVASNGSITLSRAASLVQAGLGYRSILKTVRLETESVEGGTTQTKKGRISRLGIRFEDTLGAKYGKSEDAGDLQTVYFRTSASLMDNPPNLFSGDKEVIWDAGWETDRYVVVVQDQPLPLTVNMLVPHVTVNR